MKKREKIFDDIRRRKEMLEQPSGYPQEKYYRKKPVREFDLNQTLYNTIFDQNKNNMDV